MSGKTGPALRIRVARQDDVEALLAIFALYVTQGTVSFEYQVPTVSAFREKIAHILGDYPVFVALMGDAPVGYCYASRFRGQAAYDWAVETTIYIHPAHHGQGIGRRLYQTLEDALARQRVITLYACISAAHAQSVAFHHHLGYREMARFQGVGYKMGEWLDIIWMEKRLGPKPDKPDPFIPFGMLEQGDVGAV